jgi:hypothetical protein
MITQRHLRLIQGGVRPGAPTLATRIAMLQGQLPPDFVEAWLSAQEPSSGAVRAALAEAARVPVGDA